MKNILNVFKTRLKHREENGFTLIEMVVAIPLMTLVGGFMVFAIAQSMEISKTSATLSQSSANIRQILTDVQSSTTCYDLQKKTADKKIKADNSHAFTVQSEIKDDSGAIVECTPNKILTVTATAKQDSNGKVLYFNSSNVFISE